MNRSRHRNTALHSALATAALAFVGLAGSAHAQSAIIYGALSNFDISNDTGRVCHGFEIDLPGLQPTDVQGSFSAQRYGLASINGYVGGVKVRWQGTFANGAWNERTLPHTVPWFPGQCYSWNTGTYQAAGCEHFGTYITASPNNVAMRWLCEDANLPADQLLAVDPPTAVASPFYYVAPPAVPAQPPQLVVEVPAPEPAERPELFGDAQWERVFVTELPRAVTLDELLADNPAVVPMDPAQLEADYSILQNEPAAGGNGKRKRHRHTRAISPTTRTVVRRIELWSFTGNYDPVTHEALCLDGTCNIPDPSELGQLISVQMTAANVEPDALIVARPAGGEIDSDDKLIACGSKCAQNYNAGQVVKLTVKAASGQTFLGWTGACAAAGTSGSCSVTINHGVNVGANFGSLNTLSIGRANSGTVTSNLPGINCGNTCSAKFQTGSVITLTATPPVGKSFVGWSNGCSGTAPTCTLTLSGNTSVQASFSK